MSRQRIILGIDPGLADVGFGVIRQNGNEIELLEYAGVRTRSDLAPETRLKKISDKLSEIIKKQKPDVAAIEQIFFCKNIKTALLIGQARGALMLTLGNARIPVLEYTPLQVKQALTSYGRASKNQIQQMVKLILKMPEAPKPDDVADALAIAICCAHHL